MNISEDGLRVALTMLTKMTDEEAREVAREVEQQGAIIDFATRLGQLSPAHRYLTEALIHICAAGTPKAEILAALELLITHVRDNYPDPATETRR